MSSDEKTCIAELRLKVGSICSIAEFRQKKNLRLLNLDNNKTLKDFLIHKNKKDIKDRIVQASQYGLNFWPFVKKDIRIIYIDNNNQIMAIFLHKNSDFLKVIKEKLPIETMAEKMTVEFISTNV